ncbi:hypothetical protein L1987_78106 [Smallanthus sonchifolius]|uniref:Uncharacterized protein n=1 Tax=Smallanthus sonchifolius TaxID=185202 RepID=A0ACB8ZCS5_9ASTR|nr:hypothetical protein L1987_78106 [Smallanthus sonchifolius]
MESKTLPPVVDYSSNVDTSSAFRSVKEAVEIFGERFLTGEILLPKQELTPSWKSTHSSRTSWRSFSPPREIEEPLVINSLKKLESELEETKKELRLLKEKELETEAALASLNAELRKKTTQGLAMDMVVSGDRKVVKKKPMIPFLGGLFSKRKGKADANSIVNPLYASSQMHWI